MNAIGKMLAVSVSVLVTAGAVRAETITLQNGVNAYAGCTDLWLDMGNKSNTHASDTYLRLWGNGAW